MDWSDYLEHISFDGNALVEAARGSMETAVPCCPGWQVSDVVSHTGVVHRHKTMIVENRLQGNPDPPDAPDEGLSEWFRDGLDHMLAVLRRTDPSDQVFTWHEADQTVGFWYRRMAHETLIHRVDVEQAIGRVGHIDPGLAADGIDEVLTVYVGGYPTWGTFDPDGTAATIACSDQPRRWAIRFGRFSGRSPRTDQQYELDAFEATPADGEGAATITGTAADLDLWLWGRGALDRLTGDRDLATRLRTICAEDMG